MFQLGRYILRTVHDRCTTRNTHKSDLNNFNAILSWLLHNTHRTFASARNTQRSYCLVSQYLLSRFMSKTTNTLKSIWEHLVFIEQRENISEIQCIAQCYIGESIRCTSTKLPHYTEHSNFTLCALYGRCCVWYMC